MQGIKLAVFLLKIIRKQTTYQSRGFQVRLDFRILLESNQEQCFHLSNCKSYGLVIFSLSSCMQISYLHLPKFKLLKFSKFPSSEGSWPKRELFPDKGSIKDTHRNRLIRIEIPTIPRKK